MIKLKYCVAIVIAPAIALYASYYLNFKQTSACDFLGNCGAVNASSRGAPVFWSNGEIDYKKLFAGYTLWLAIFIVLAGICFIARRKVSKKQILSVTALAIALQATSHFFVSITNGYETTNDHSLPPYHTLGDGFMNVFYTGVFWLGTSIFLMWLLPRIGKLKTTKRS